MGDLVDYIAEKFNVSELVIVAESVGLAPTSRWGNRRLIDAINAKIQKDGIPEPPEDNNNMSREESLVEEFLFMAGYINDDGDIIEQKLEGNNLSIEQFMQSNDIKKLPDCYTYADDNDPACKRCIVYKFCAEERIANLPPCYAILWDQNSVECKVCMEQPFCKEAKLKGEY